MINEIIYLKRVSDEHMSDVCGERSIDAAVKQLLVDLLVVLQLDVIVTRRARINVAISRIVTTLFDHKFLIFERLQTALLLRAVVDRLKMIILDDCAKKETTIKE